MMREIRKKNKLVLFLTSLNLCLIKPREKFGADIFP